MAELGSTLPYFEHIRIIERLTEEWVPTGQVNQNGQELAQRLDVVPGIRISTATYLNDIKGPSYPFTFPSKKFFQDQLAKLKAAPTQSEAIAQQIAYTESLLTNPEIYWCESILEAVGLPELGMLWADVFSDSLNLFPRWSDANRGTGGIPVVIQPVEWDIRVPVDSAKVVTLKIGMYSDAEALKPGEVYNLVFQDEETAENRTNNIANLQARLDNLNTQIDELPEGPSTQRTQLTNERRGIQTQLNGILKTDTSTITNLMNNQSVQQRLGLLLAGLIHTLKAVRWPELDADLAISKLPENLAAIK